MKTFTAETPPRIDDFRDGLARLYGANACFEVTAAGRAALMAETVADFTPGILPIHFCGCSYSAVLNCPINEFSTNNAVRGPCRRLFATKSCACLDPACIVGERCISEVFDSPDVDATGVPS